MLTVSGDVVCLTCGRKFSEHAEVISHDFTDPGISMRFVQPMVLHPESSVSVVCGCGKSFDYFGVDATQKVAAFMHDHDCKLMRLAAEGMISAQRLGDEPV